MKLHYKILLRMLVMVGILVAAGTEAAAAVAISSTVGASGKYLVTQVPVTGTAPAMIKLTFENRTAGTKLELCAGAGGDFAGGYCPMSLANSVARGAPLLTIVDMATLSGKVLYVRSVAGTAASTFVLTVE
jgi:hypothetical protein